MNNYLDCILYETRKFSFDLLIRKQQIYAREADVSIGDYHWETEKFYFLWTYCEKCIDGIISYYNRSEKEEKLLEDAIEYIEQITKEYFINNKNKFVYSETQSTWQQYELMCYALLESLGWNVFLTEAGADFGVDLIATKNNLKVAIQCKKHKNTLGIKAVQEVFSGAKYHDCEYMMVCSNVGYSKSSKKLALNLGVKLLHHDYLLVLDDILKENTPSSVFIHTELEKVR